MTNRSHPPAQPHGALRELFDDVFFVTGTVRIGGPLPMAFSRNMTVVRSGTSLTLINAIRLDEPGLAALSALGSVDHVIRVAAFHGMDDPFYQERYGAKVWAVEGSTYVSGFGSAKDKAKGAYFEPNVWMTSDTELPIAHARLHCIASARSPEGLVHLDRDGGILVTGDSLQNWASADAYFNLPAKLAMRAMGFIRPHNVGPAWLRGAKPASEDLHAILDLDLTHLLPAHGSEVIGDVKAKYAPSITRAAAKIRSTT